jgi:hypothetical protein
VRKKLCVGVNGNIEEIRNIVNSVDCIGSIYTSDYIKKTAGGRNVSYLNNIAQIREIAEFLKENNVEYYLTNNHTVFTKNKEDPRFWPDFKEHMQELENAGVTGIVTGHPFFIDCIKKSTGMKVCLSTTAEVSNGRIASYYEDMGVDVICPSYSVNYDMEKLEEIKNSLKYTTLKLLVNEMCLGDCPYRRYHQNAYFSDLDLDKDYGMVCHKIMITAPEKMLQNNTVRPEDIHNYFHISNNIKISLRQPPFYDPEKNLAVVKAYGDEKYVGNYIDLVSQRLAQLIFIDNTGLDGLYEQKISCKMNCNTCKLCSNMLKRSRQKKEPTFQTA